MRPLWLRWYILCLICTKANGSDLFTGETDWIINKNKRKHCGGSLDCSVSVKQRLIWWNTLASRLFPILHQTPHSVERSRFLFYCSQGGIKRFWSALKVKIHPGIRPLFQLTAAALCRSQLWVQISRVDVSGGRGVLWLGGIEGQNSWTWHSGAEPPSQLSYELLTPTDKYCYGTLAQICCVFE